MVVNEHVGAGFAITVSNGAEQVDCPALLLTVMLTIYVPTF
ncbi:MAG: hypothetical protein WCJ45_09090 [bacterium]